MNAPVSFLDGRVVLHGGDCREVIRTLADGSIDAIVTDPPYALVSLGKRFGKAGAKNGSKDAYARASAGFMGKQWDTGEAAFAAEFWAECLRVLKPGGHVAAFSGTRTYHRLACAIEDAGFEIRDQLAWAYGTGFPKSHDVSKAIDKSSGVEFAVKPATGVGFMGADGPGGYNPTKNQMLRVGDMSDAARKWQGWGTALKPAWEPIALARKPLAGTVAENVLAHGTGAFNLDGCRVLDGTETGGEKPLYMPNGKNAVYGAGAGGGEWANTAGRHPANILHDGSGEVLAAFADFVDDLAVDLNPARFFYSAKADAQDRIGSKHPTVKPVDLMQWLCRLITPPGGVVLDPFSGTGTTGEAAWREGFSAVLIEREEEYRADIARRMALAVAGRDERRRESIKAKGLPDDLGPLFGGASFAPGGGAGDLRPLCRPKRQIGPIGLKR